MPLQSLRNYIQQSPSVLLIILIPVPAALSNITGTDGMATLVLSLIYFALGATVQELTALEADEPAVDEPANVEEISAKEAGSKVDAKMEELESTIDMLRWDGRRLRRQRDNIWKAVDILDCESGAASGSSYGKRDDEGKGTIAKRVKRVLSIVEGM
ncbi:hypothetical protein BU16DRAFT_559544 [Lophium mytilinum]|uniref:Uncharacterized protein n=1 Tax=Lophium mytilinum TaxID=390894 RepID=A0A6A6R350_9PEZI|nr:hypothetical protein BU16DRAFT_559544 [Lophium mytilinum]